MLGDPAGLALDDLGVTDRVEQSRLTVVDVTHDGHDRRTRLQVLVLLVLDARVQVDVEGVEEFLLLLLRGDDLDVVAELGAEHLEGVLVERLRRRRHLTEVEEHGDEAAGVRIDLVREVGERGAATHPDDGRTVTAGDAHAADRRRLHLLEFLTLRALGLAATDRTSATATERTLGAAATAGTTRTTAAGAESTATAARTEATAATGTPGTTAAARRTLTGARHRRLVRHHAGVRARTTRTRGTGARTTRTRRTGTRTTGACGTRTRPTGTGAGSARSTRTTATGTALRARHPLALGERVVARTRGTLATRAHALVLRERVVARTRRGRTRTGTARTRRTGLPAIASLATLAGRRRARTRRRRSLTRGGRGRRRRGRGGLRSRGGRTARTGCRGTGGRASRRRAGARRGLRRSGGRCRGRRAGCRCRLGGGRRGLRGTLATGRTGRRGRSRSGTGLAGLARRRCGAGRLGCGATGGLAARGQLRREGLTDLPHDRRLDRRARGSDEFSLILQMVEQGLALDSELFSELVDPDLSHFSPRLRSGLSIASSRQWTVVSAGCCSSLSTHRMLISVKPAFGLTWMWCTAAEPGGSTQVLLGAPTAASDPRRRRGRPPSRPPSTDAELG